jgi:hypothetical protein
LIPRSRIEGDFCNGPRSIGGQAFGKRSIDC